MSNENPYDFGPGASATAGPTNAGFTVGKIDAMQCLQEGWALIQDKYLLFLGISFVGGLIGGAVPIILLGPMLCGTFYALLKRMRGEEVQFDDLFKGFDYFKDSLIATLIIALIGLVVFFILGIGWVIVMVLGAAAGESLGPIVFIFGMVLLVVAEFVIILGLQFVVTFVYPLIVDRGLAPMDAVKTSWAAAKANTGGLVTFLILSGLAAIVGLMVGCIGIYFVVPVLQAGQAVVYRRVFPAAAAPAKAMV